MLYSHGCSGPTPGTCEDASVEDAALGADEQRTVPTGSHVAPEVSLDLGQDVGRNGHPSPASRRLERTGLDVAMEPLVARGDHLHRPLVEIDPSAGEGQQFDESKPAPSCRITMARY